MKKKVSDVKDNYSINNCSIVNTSAPTNEFTAQAVVALAKAAEANANAIAEIARALKGADVRMENGIKIGR